MNDIPSPDSSAELLARWRAGDEQAAAKLWRRHAARLIGLARSLLSTQLARYVDPEDLVQSAYRSFFAGARSDLYILRHSGDLWRLLVTITRHKLRDQFKRHQAQKRRPGRRGNAGEPSRLVQLQTDVAAHEPSPDDAAALTDELTLVLGGLEPWQRRMVELRLQGYKLGEIAAATQHHERTVRRLLNRVKQHLQQRCREWANP